MRTPRADSVYVTIVLLIALTVVGFWSLRAEGEAVDCGAECAGDAAGPAMADGLSLAR